MRVAVTVLSVLAATTAGAIAQGRIPVPANQAVLACEARAGYEIERRYGGTAEPIGRFTTLRMHAGWRVRGVYLARNEDVEQRFDIACDVTPEGVDLVTAIRAD
jgi:hypothetical protein